MNAKRTKCLRAVGLAIFLGAGGMAQAHPGPPGHYHPDEVDEFDEVSLMEPAASKSFDVGGLLVLAVITASIAFAFFQKEGGIWTDPTRKH